MGFHCVVSLVIYTVEVEDACFFTVLDDEDDAGLITTGSIVTVSVTVIRRNLGVSSFWFKNFEVILSYGTLY